MSSRLLPIGVLTAVVLVLGVIVLSISLTEPEEDVIEVTGSTEVQGLIGGIRQLGPRLGDEGAPVTITVFTDVQCQRCATFQREVVEPLITDYVRGGEAKLELRHFPLGLNPVTLGAVATEAAGEQDRQWQYADLFLRNLDQVPEQGVTEEFIERVAAATPELEIEEWREAMGEPGPGERAQEDVELATELRLAADPALVVDGAGGSETLEGGPTLEEAVTAIERVRP
jgi:protein-disulfide isomerase